MNSISKFPNFKFSPFFLLSFIFCLGCKSKTGSGFTLLDPSQTGVAFTNVITETKDNNIMTYQYMYNGAGIAAGDINNDGLPDLYIAGNSVPNKLFMNKGNWKFEDITASASLKDRQGDWKTGVTMADVNGDGWLDIYVCYSGNTAGEGLRKPVLIDNPHRNNQLFINKGCKPGGVPVFVESAREYGLEASGTFSTQAYFFDYDRDGDLDMFLVNHANTFYSSLFNTTSLRKLRHPFFGNKLYRNDGNKFIEVSEQAGIYGSGLNYGLSAGISDLNGDNWPDIYVTNDYDEQDFCYLNNTKGGFTEVSHEAFGHISKYSMGCDIADINNDNLPDIFVADMLPEDNHRQKLLKGADQFDKYTLAVDSGYHHQNMRNTLQLNVGNKDSIPHFSEIGQMAGVSNTDWSWSPLLADFDNDGLKDLLVTNGYLHDYTNMDFLKYVQTEINNSGQAYSESYDMLPVIQKMPSTRISSYLFQNKGNAEFANKTDDWGLSQKSISNAAAYADFDNDGDLDIMINKLNEPVSIYRNDIKSGNRYIKIRLIGNAPNTNGVGARIEINTGRQIITQEAFYGRGYESSVEPRFTIGVGQATFIEEIKVLWPDGKYSFLKNVASNQLIKFEQSNAISYKENFSGVLGYNLFYDDIKRSGIDFVHTENRDFVDFKVQRLIPYQASRLGGRLAVGDVNKDGNDDIYFGGPIHQGGALFLGKDDGSFARAATQPWEQDKSSEDIGASFFDADNDSDLDLYVVSGGNEYGSGDPLYHDRLYINDGKGNFTKNTTALPATETTSGSCVVAADYDKDGDMDLFVGGRLSAQLYPFTPKSFVFRNDSKNGEVKFTDVTELLNKDISQAGMVTDAVWNDVDKDGWTDLLMVGEWMPVRIFQNQKGKGFTEISSSAGLNGTEGWWSRIFPADVDEDGDMDFLLGNAGVNLQYHASPREPMEYIVQDINNDGGPDPVLCYYIQGKSYPAPSMDELLEQVTALRKKFFRYQDYSDATVSDLMDKDLLNAAYRLRINTLRSSWMENIGNGKFKVRPLPDKVQCSMINGFVWGDFDGDERKELLCAGNFYPYRVEWGRSDAFMGAMLKFEKDSVSVYKSGRGLGFSGDIRDMALVKSTRGGSAIIVSRDNDRPGLFTTVIMGPWNKPITVVRGEGIRAVKK